MQIRRVGICNPNRPDFLKKETYKRRGERKEEKKKDSDKERKKKDSDKERKEKDLQTEREKKCACVIRNGLFHKDLAVSILASRKEGVNNFCGILNNFFGIDSLKSLSVFFLSHFFENNFFFFRKLYCFLFLKTIFL
jgi:hypothetical protein